MALGMFCGPGWGLLLPFPHSVPWGKVRMGVQALCASVIAAGSSMVRCWSKCASCARIRAEAEAKLWYHLRRRNLGYRFQRSYTIEGFIADFRCHEGRLVVEVDGGQHADNVAYDERRTAKMGEDGYRVIRLWNSEVLSNIDGVLEAIGNALEKDPAPPS